MKFRSFILSAFLALSMPVIVLSVFDVGMVETYAAEITERDYEKGNHLIYSHSNNIVFENTDIEFYRASSDIGAIESVDHIIVNGENIQDFNYTYSSITISGVNPEIRQYLTIEMYYTTSRSKKYVSSVTLEYIPLSDVQYQASDKYVDYYLIDDIMYMCDNGYSSGYSLNYEYIPFVKDGINFSTLDIDGGVDSNWLNYKDLTFNVIMTPERSTYKNIDFRTLTLRDASYASYDFENCTADYIILDETCTGTHRSMPFADTYDVYGNVSDGRFNASKEINIYGNVNAGFCGDAERVNVYGKADGKISFSGDSIWFFGDVESTFKIEGIGLGSRVYVNEGSTIELLLKNSERQYELINEENLYGKRPSLKQEGFMFDAKSPKDLKYRVDLGKKPDGADDVKSVTVDNVVIDSGSWEFNGSNYVTLYKNFLSTLSNGTHTIGVEFDNGVYSAGATVTIINSTIPSGGNGQEPPEALVTVKYEFYKDYPDYVIIPVKLNGASAITHLRIGTTVVDPVNYKLEDGAIILNKDYLSELEPAKYRVLPTFNDANQTTITNIQLIVYEKAADRAAPYLLQSRIIFDGSDVILTFDPGYGQLSTTNVLALVVDNNIVLPNGETLPLSLSNMKNLQKAFKLDEELFEGVATTSNATPSNAKRRNRKNKLDELSTILSDMVNSVFTVNDCVITFDGDYVSEMNLKVGDHLIGAIFDNTEKTTDLKKVILTIEGDEDGNGDNKPVEPEDPNKPVDPENPNGGEDNKPIEPEKPVDPDEGSGSSSGGSGGGNTNTVDSGDNNNKLPDGSINPDFKPIIPDDGGHFEGSGNDWTYIKPDGSHAKDEWVSSGGDWYYIGEDGKLEYDWFLDKQTNKWHMLNREHDGKFGAVKIGWYYEKQDGKWYFFNPVNGDMLLHWQFIGGKWYFLTPANKGQTYFGDNVNGWYYKPDVEARPFGSMYINETTPDGYMVDSTGAWIK